MHKSTRNISSVNGSSVDLETENEQLRLELEVIHQAARENYDTAEALGNEVMRLREEIVGLNNALAESVKKVSELENPPVKNKTKDDEKVPV